MSIHLLGIRHHGPGSARNVRAFLESLTPDIVLVEGPPEADGILQWAGHAELIPPVAILCYQPENPQQSSFYPFAEFSPEWQAICYARKNNIHVRFMDLPACNRFAIENEKKQVEPTSPEIPPDIDNALPGVHEASPAELPEIKKDPVRYLAEAAGFDDGEKWWEQMFEYRQANEQVFDAVNEAMTVLRESFPRADDRLEQLREAHMRKVIRQAEKEMFQRIVVICGAWHVPALEKESKQKEDSELLKGLPKVKVECTWIPWTYNRLSFYSGYGAGIGSPGWYEHIWQYPTDDGTKWMSKVARLFRKNRMDTSVAHVIEGVRLAESLASLRNLSKAGLEELNEATLSVLCNGESIMLGLVHDELIVSNKIGSVPEEIPKPPLQLDIEKLQKRLRMPATADWKDYTLDLRKDNDLERSIFLHRLQLLSINWGHRSEIAGKGTFKEQWRLQWDPSFAVEIIEKGTWGNTVAEASANYVINQAKSATSLAEVCLLLQHSIPAEIPGAVEELIRQIDNLAAASGDTLQLMEVIPGLVNVSRYGNVRKTDSDLVLGIVSSMITRICVSLPAACMAVDEDAADKLLDLFLKMNDAVNLLQEEETSQEWQHTLSVIAAGKNTSPIISGYTTRLLADYKLLAGEELVKVFYYAMSSAAAPAMAAAWLEGFLKGSGTLLLIDNDLWMIVHNWVNQLGDELFNQLLPLLRRTFSEFSPAERRKLGEKVKLGTTVRIERKSESSFDHERGIRGIPVIMRLLGYPTEQQTN